jgi:hypothetical protein
MNIIKFHPQNELSEQEKIEIARQELLAEVRLMEAQGLLDFVEIEQQPGKVVQLFNCAQQVNTDKQAEI